MNIRQDSQQEGLQGLAVENVVQQGLDWDAGAAEDGRAAEDLGIHGNGKPDPGHGWTRMNLKS